jgi:hypothetical protein
MGTARFCKRMFFSHSPTNDRLSWRKRTRCGAPLRDSATRWRTKRLSSCNDSRSLIHFCVTDLRRLICSGQSSRKIIRISGVVSMAVISRRRSSADFSPQRDTKGGFVFLVSCCGKSMMAEVRSRFQPTALRNHICRYGRPRLPLTPPGPSRIPSPATVP